MSKVEWDRNDAAVSQAISFSQRALAALPSSLGESLNGKIIYTTGSTGFFGVWIHFAIEALRLGGCKVRLLRTSRNHDAFATTWPSLSSKVWASWVQTVHGSDYVIAESFDYCLHMGASSDAAVNMSNPVGMISSAFNGNVELGELCARRNARLLFTSSGAVYGKRSHMQGPAIESDAMISAPDPLDPRQAYGESKRVGEMALALHPKLLFTVARPYAFLGPYLPLDKHFAAGNFLRNAATGSRIVIGGDGRPVRSYMHPADMAAWLLWLMAFGPDRSAVNVGSSEAITIQDLATTIARIAGSAEPVIKGAALEPDYYVPDLSLAGSLGLKNSIGFEEAISSSLKTIVSIVDNVGS